MIEYNKIELEKVAREHGFVRDTFEKVLRLKEVLAFIQYDEYLREFLALKGGTAINMAVFSLPRLSVDIDLDFTQNLSRDESESVRANITKRLHRYMEAKGYQLPPASRYSLVLILIYFIIEIQVETKTILR